MGMLAGLSPQLRQYLLVTGNYWVFTLSDGALRMLVLLHFHGLGYSPLDIAMLFLFYEIFGVITNLIGGWLATYLGLNNTMNLGLALQVVALAMLLVPANQLVVTWVMAAQALSGIAKDLNKMSAKSAVKLLVPSDAQSKLYQWVAILTGSKNAFKGLGFFLGAGLLELLGFTGAVGAMAGVLAVVCSLSLVILKKDLGKAKNKPKFTEIFSKSRALNYLSVARMFLFCARDVWFVVALPVFLASKLNWDHWSVGGFLALWIIGYGAVQSVSPYFTGERLGKGIGKQSNKRLRKVPDGNSAFVWASVLSIIPAFIAFSLHQDFRPEFSLLIGIMVFGVLFAINSSLHSYLIVSYADKGRVSLDVGFYYMANSMGRLAGTILSGWLYQVAGLEGCLWVSSGFVVMAALTSIFLPKHQVEGA